MSAPPEGSPYWKLDAALRETLDRSFRARVERVRGAPWILDDGARLGADDEATLNLANGFWGRSPSAAWEAAQNAGAEWVSMLVRIYERMKAIDPTLGLWRQIKYLRNGWWGGSGGFKVVYFDPAEMRSRLDSLATNTRGNKVARDHLFGSLEHQLESSLEVLGKSLLARPLALLDPDTDPPDADTWREVDRPEQEGLHFCVSRQDTGPAPGRHVKLDDIHLDWRSPVVGINARRRCQYTDALGSLQHWMQAMLHLAKPAFFFHDTEESLQALRDPKRALPPAIAPERDALQAEWESRKWELAVQGQSGLGPARAYHARATALVKRLPRGS